MMELVLYLLMVGTTLTMYISYVPQIVKIIKTKKSDDISATSWVLWVTATTLDVIYAILLRRPELMLASISEWVLNATVLLLCIKYRSKRNEVNLLGFEFDVTSHERHILRYLIRSYSTTSEQLREIIRKVDDPAVIVQILALSSDDPRATDDVRRLAQAKYTKLTGGAKDGI